MKYRRKPVSRDIADALFDGSLYHVQRESGIEKINAAEFERDYEPLKRKPREKKVKRTKKKDALDPSNI